MNQEPQPLSRRRRRASLGLASVRPDEMPELDVQDPASLGRYLGWLGTRTLDALAGIARVEVKVDALEARAIGELAVAEEREARSAASSKRWALWKTRGELLGALFGAAGTLIGAAAVASRWLF